MPAHLSPTVAAVGPEIRADGGPHAGAPLLAAARDLLSLGKPRILFAVGLACLTGFVIAPRLAPVATFAPIASALACVTGTLLLSAAACALNMWIERDGDRRMARTADRPLPGGRLSPIAAVALAVALAPAGALLLWAREGAGAAALGVVSLVLYSFVYTPLKRRTSLAFLAGLAPGALPALLGAQAAAGAIEGAGLALFAFICLWQVPHVFSLHVWQADAYAAAGIRSLVARVGTRPLRRASLAGAIALGPAAAGVARVAGAGAVCETALCACGALLFIVGRVAWPAEGGAEGARRFFRCTLFHLAAVLTILSAARAWPG